MTTTINATSNSSSNSCTLDDLDPAVLNSEFVSSQPANNKKSLRITCYGSSSAKTPSNYLQAARSLGYILAKRGHVCINGAGPFGCMAAMNDGAVLGNGHIVGVIHEMFLVDSGYFLEDNNGNNNKKVNIDDVGTHKVFQKQNPNDETGAIREILVAGGPDLQERKKLLVENADALVVLPGGPGTWDELWEMACARHLGLVNLPIVCINVDNYYQPFRDMLDRAYNDKLIRLKPSEIVHFSNTVQEAVEWCEVEAAKNSNNSKNKSNNNKDGSNKKTLSKRQQSELNKSSFYSPLEEFNNNDSSNNNSSMGDATNWRMMELGLAMTGGILLGVAFGLAFKTKGK
eukprot:scaffold2288_cov87-Cylindrotheca_fusiformis.AAC.6